MVMAWRPPGRPGGWCTNGGRGSPPSRGSGLVLLVLFSAVVVLGAATRTGDGPPARPGTSPGMAGHR